MSQKKITLSEMYPDIAAQWHPTKNKGLTPDMVTPKSGKNVWWYLPYDDPLTGKHFDFEWEMKIYNRTERNQNCPYISGQRVWKGFNDLETCRPDLAKEWHPTKNKGLTPDMVTPKSGKKVWWYLPYDDPLTGKHFDFEWEMCIVARVEQNQNCPYISGQRVWKGFNDLETCRPDLAKEWHPTKNKGLTPDMVTPKSGKNVWWYLPYDDPLTGKHFDFEWEMRIYLRAERNQNCPFISGNRVWKGFNDLETCRPDLAKKWHPTKNKGLTPDMVTPKSGKKVWWYLPYDDPLTGKHFDFEWEARIAAHVEQNQNCPYLSGKRVWKGFNDLETCRPDLAKEWHPTKNKGLTPDMVTTGSDKNVWWYLPYDDPLTGKHFDFEWEARIADRTKQNQNCPYVSGKKVWKGFNDLETCRPDLAKEWHPTKNKGLTPDMVTTGSNKNVWWYLPYDDPLTGKHFDFEWETRIYFRAERNQNCPFISGNRVWKGFNDLETCRPDLAKEWHPTKNKGLTPDMVTPGSRKKVWWYLPYDDPLTGKHFDFEWEMRIHHRAERNQNCPYISGHRVWKGFNDLETCRPDLAKEWHPTKNKGLTPDMVTPKSGKKVWWYLPYDDPLTGKHFDFEWDMNIIFRAEGKKNCPYLSGQRVWKGFNDLETCRPDLAKEWHPTKNKGLTPDMVTTGSRKNVWWYLPYDDPLTGKHFDFEWAMRIYYRTERNQNCPYISGQRVWKGFNDLETCRPDLAKEWHPTKNKRRRPENTLFSTNNKAWWKCKHCGHVWYAPISGRTLKGAGCSECLKERKRNGNTN